MIEKRPFFDENCEEVACKHPRQMESIDQLDPMGSLGDNNFKPHVSDNAGEETLSKCEDVERSAGDLVMESSQGANKDVEAGDAVRFPHFLWITNAIQEAGNLSFFPELLDNEHQLRALLHPDEVFSSVDYPFRKPVSVGPEHQAYIPEWDACDASTSANQLGGSDPQIALAKPFSPDVKTGDVCKEKLMGTCVIPMPELEASENYHSEFTVTECRCVDVGSIRCVRQHVMETREKLRENLGEEIFEELGFVDMGEEMAKKWAEEEEEAFNQIILSNPASLSRNFWDHLSAAFPFRTRNEIVSYYFNVFMLRKRAEQNRFDPLNIDSDDDEWQIREAGMEEDEDSVVESLNDRDTIHDQEEGAEDFNEDIEDGDEIGNGVKDNAVQKVGTDDEYEGDVDDIPGAFSGCCSDDIGFNSNGGIPCKSVDDSDVQDDSCTSFECQQNGVDCSGAFDMETNGGHSSDE